MGRVRSPQKLVQITSDPIPKGTRRSRDVMSNYPGFLALSPVGRIFQGNVELYQHRFSELSCVKLCRRADSAILSGCLGCSQLVMLSLSVQDSLAHICVSPISFFTCYCDIISNLPKNVAEIAQRAPVYASVSLSTWNHFI